MLLGVNSPNKAINVTTNAWHSKFELAVLFPVVHYTLLAYYGEG
ncbi:hypothetical protein VCR12J2_80018 [Vibrio coralliirubri]|nr:hypothetical protein VCR12J2_80018 [Vibrio coralliirubri]